MLSATFADSKLSMPPSNVRRVLPGEAAITLKTYCRQGGTAPAGKFPEPAADRFHRRCNPARCADAITTAINSTIGRTRSSQRICLRRQPDPECRRSQSRSAGPKNKFSGVIAASPGSTLLHVARGIEKLLSAKVADSMTGRSTGQIWN